MTRPSLRSFLLLGPLISSVCALTYAGADFSSLVNLENSGVRYYDGSRTAEPFETILVNHGANLARIRVWTSTSDSEYSLGYALALGKRAANAGMALMIDLHYSDSCKYILVLGFNRIGLTLTSASKGRILHSKISLVLGPQTSTG